ncbi:heme-binding protein 1 isoform X3 [Canis aureus]
MGWRGKEARISISGDAAIRWVSQGRDDRLNLVHAVRAGGRGSGWRAKKKRKKHERNPEAWKSGAQEEVSYEERTCEGGRFATVEVTDKPVDEGLREAMPKVMKYVGGTNDKGIGMGMTVPVSFAVFPGDDGSLQKKLKVWFRIPNQFQSNPPVPTDDSIKIEERESITVYSL